MEKNHNTEASVQSLLRENLINWFQPPSSGTKPTRPISNQTKPSQGFSESAHQLGDEDDKTRR